MNCREKMKKPEYRRMYEVLKKRLSENIMYAIMQVFLFDIIMSFLITSGFFPVYISNGSAAGYVVSAVLTFMMLVVVFTMVYGLISSFTNIILGKKIAPGGMFSGFIENSRTVFNASVFFSVLVVFVTAVSIALTFSLEEKIIAFFSFPQIEFEHPSLTPELCKKISDSFSLCMFFSMAFSVLFVLLITPFIFTWNVILENKKATFKAAVKKTLFVICGRYFHYMGFVIFSCLKNTVFLFILIFLKALAFQNNFLSLLIGFFAFIQCHTIFSKAYFCIPIYYFSFLSVNGMTGGAGNEHSS
ncbi:hypothetical protein [Treponema sp.]|uniref:hypothetical protein n=1 Tax=Treponema sp. TaxID=166 RepID=UPI003F00D923